MKLDFFKGESGAYFSIIGMTALSFSFIIPVMTLFLVQELNIEPGYIGLYTVGTALATMVFSQLQGGLCDRGIDSKKLFMFAALAMALGGFSFSILTEFWQALLVGIFFMSFGGSAISLLFAMIRRYAERSRKDSTKISSQMRAAMSLLWVVGPALAFASMDHLGARANFVLAGVISCIVFVYAGFKLKPDIKPTVHNDEGTDKKQRKMPKEVWFLGAGIFFGSLANAVYLNAMPLFMTKELDMPLSFPGILIGMTAGLEIPVMLLAARWAHHFGKVRMMRWSFIFGLFFYVGMEICESYWGFVLLQLSNGLFFGTFAGLGVTVLQDYATKIVGKVSAFYTNCMSIGNMCGTSLLGLVAQYFGFRNTLYVSMVAITVSFVIFYVFEIRARKAELASLAVQAG